MRRIERNCESIQRLMDEPGFPATSRAINKRIQAFALRDEQLALLVGPMKASEMSFAVFRKAIGSER
jgi:hypothetical protein